MSNKMRPHLTQGLSMCLLMALSSATVYGAAPKGWFVAGNDTTNYDAGIDTLATYGGHTSAYLKANQLGNKIGAIAIDKAIVTNQGERVGNKFGTLMQSFGATHYLGKKVRFSAFVKFRTGSSVDWAGLWMRVDSGPTTAAFDNMHDRPITGTTDWQKYDVVLDVPQNATGISLGILLAGTGTVWLNAARLEIVEPMTLPMNGDVIELPDEPSNIDFDQ